MPFSPRAPDEYECITECQGRRIGGDIREHLAEAILGMYRRPGVSSNRTISWRSRNQVGTRLGRS